MKIYTKLGDSGKTALADGSRVEKSALRIEAYGTVDELNANLAFLRDLMSQERSEDPIYEKARVSIHRIQNELFEIGSELALSKQTKNPISKEHVLTLENEIDDFWNELEPLRNFVLPGGHLINSQAHICRCICRRSERILCHLDSENQIRSELIMYFNRLSDWFFALSRYASKVFKREELLWKSQK